MNPFYYISRSIIKRSFDLSVYLIERLHNMTAHEQKVASLRQLPARTLGNDIARCLDDHKLRLVPNYESHDLKHVLLDYKMTPVDEICMQAFMLGNGNYTLPCFVILGFGAVLLPAQWRTLIADYRRGRAARPVSGWTIEEFAEMETTTLRQFVFDPAYIRQSAFTMKAIIKFASTCSIIAGISGMLFCLPFLFSSSLADLVGAGFPFVSGAILTAGGLITLSNLSKQRLQNAY